MRYSKSIFLAATLSILANQVQAQNVGIGQPNPVSKIDINGNATVGSGYTGVTPAPTDGMNIEGQVVVGRSTPIIAFDKASVFTSDDNFAIAGYVSNGLPTDAVFGVLSSCLYGAIDGDGGLGLLIDHTALADFGALININQTGTTAAIKGDSNDPDAHGVMGETTNTGLGFAVYGNGDINTTGAYFTISDARLKQDIKPYTGGLATIMSLSPKTYLYRPELAAKYNFSTRPQVGFLAQDLEQTMPNMVRASRLTSVGRTTRDGKGNVATETMDAKTVNYDALIPVLTQAIQEQQAQINTLQTQVGTLQAEIDQLKKERK
jgi:hypothetical protein